MEKDYVEIPEDTIKALGIPTQEESSTIKEGACGLSIWKRHVILWASKKIVWIICMGFFRAIKKKRSAVTLWYSWIRRRLKNFKGDLDESREW